MSTAVVIPAFNEAGSIGKVAAAVAERGYEVIVVDDGSTDGTREEARRTGSVVICHPLNRGYGAALTTGSAWALAHGYEVIVHFDADGQHDADEIARLIEPIRRQQADVVIGSRFLGGHQAVPPVRRLLIKWAILYTWILSGARLSDAHNGFRAFSSAALGRIHCREDGMAYASEVVERVTRQGLRLREVPVTVAYTDYSLRKGESNLRKLLVGLRFLWGKLTN